MRALTAASTLLSLSTTALAQDVAPPATASRIDADATWWARRGVALRREAAAARAAMERVPPPLRDARRAYAVRRDAESDAAFAESVRWLDRLPAGDVVAACARRERRASALFSGRRFEEAARGYADLRDDERCAARGHVYAGMAVLARESQIAADAQAGRLDACTAVRAGVAARLDAWDEARCRTPPRWTAPLPPVVERLREARSDFAYRWARDPRGAELWRSGTAVGADGARVPAPRGVRCAIENARMLIRFGEAHVAEVILREVLRQCRGAEDDRDALAALRDLLEPQGRRDEMEAMRRDADGCPWRNDAVSRDGPLPPSPFRHALHLLHLAEGETPGRREHAYAQASAAFAQAAREHPHHPLVAEAWGVAADAVGRAGRSAEAVALYAHALALSAGRSPEPGRRRGPEAVAAWRTEVRLRVAALLEAQGALDEALTQAQLALADARGGDPEARGGLQRRAFDALLRLVDPQRRWDAAAAALDAAVVAAEEPLRAEAVFERARLPYRAGRWRDAVRALDAWLLAPDSQEDGARRVIARWEVAQAHRRIGDDARALLALEGTAREFRERRLARGGRAAELAADALAASIEARTTALLRAPAAPPAAWRAALDAIDRDAWSADALRGAPVLVARYHAGRAFEAAAARLGDASLRRRAIERYLAALEVWEDAEADQSTVTAARDRLREGFPFAEVDAALRAHDAASRQRLRLFDATPGATLLESTRVTNASLAQ